MQHNPDCDCHDLIDNFFWFLPFSCVYQANALLDDLEDVNSADKDTKCYELKDEHKLERASQDLIDGWKDGFVKNSMRRLVSG
jgi:hypothetical protein